MIRSVREKAQDIRPVIASLMSGRCQFAFAAGTKQRKVALETTGGTVTKVLGCEERIGRHRTLTERAELRRMRRQGRCFIEALVVLGVFGSARRIRTRRPWQPQYVAPGW